MRIEMRKKKTCWRTKSCFFVTFFSFYVIHNVRQLLKDEYVVAINEVNQINTQITEVTQQQRPPANEESSKPRKVFVDLGANCGNTYYKHRQEHKEDADDWEVYLWEPSPQMHDFFLNDLKKEYPDVHIIPYAAGVKDGELKLYVHKGQEHVTDKLQFRDKGRCDPNSVYNPSGATTVFEDAPKAGVPVTVKVLNVIKWLKDLKLKNEDTFIFKLDIEGAEYEILDHMLMIDDEISYDTDAKKKRSLLCLTDLMKIEFHPGISTHLEKYKSFGNDFPKLFKQKCGRDLKIKRLS
mmetsp:Transcript_12951/g.15817  ORF Transcript_12951/g.15817 Transcript_12951/m.15817 type:complete len:294 (+) Transcript_12951:1214-2095(+)